MSLPDDWQQACDELAAADDVMRQLIVRFEGSVLKTRGAPFETLMRAIVGQQISLAAADTIWRRLCACVDPGCPASVLSVAVEPLRQAGLSQRKAEYVHDLAQHFVDGRIDPVRFAGQDDETIIQELTAVRGIGRWTAEMFLMFNLVRPDVWPVDDIGLQKAVAALYHRGERLPLCELRALGERWRPWRTVASWYLWRSLDPVEVVY
jgi:DNA-3-methyladenine glycosylase II